MAISIKSPREIDLMRQSCKLLAKVYEELEKVIRPGISTWEINEIGEKLIRQAGGVPNFLNYNGFPASICTSVNEAVVQLRIAAELLDRPAADRRVVVVKVLFLLVELVEKVR